MQRNTIKKAYAIIKEDRIFYADGRLRRTPVHWKVKQSSGKWTDVFLRFVGGVPQWSCCAISEGQGCVFYNGKHTLPFCSHTKAAQIWLRKRGIKI